MIFSDFITTLNQKENCWEAEFGVGESGNPENKSLAFLLFLKIDEIFLLRLNFVQDEKAGKSPFD